MRSSYLKNIGVLVVIGALVFSGVGAADTATVTATVTVQNISVVVSDGTVAYGTLGQDVDKATHSGDLNDTQEAGNNGNVAENFNIIGTNSANWNLSFTSGSQDKYKHTFCTASCTTPPANYTALSSASYQTLATGVAAAASQSFDLRITTPNPSTVFTQQSVNVTVQAVAN